MQIDEKTNYIQTRYGFSLTDRNIRPRVHVLNDVTGIRIESKNTLENPPCEICERSGRLASLFCPRKSAILDIIVA